MTRADLLDLAHDTAAFLAMCAFVAGAAVLANHVATNSARSDACRLAAIEPTDWNIEQCTGAPIDLAPRMKVAGGE
jgi:hypothetical protein